MQLIAPLILNALGLIFVGLAIWIGQDNHKETTNANSNRDNAKSGKSHNNLVFRILDSIPVLRRSGQATVNDLAKAMIIVLVLSFAPVAVYSPLVVDLWSLAILINTTAFILLLHPFLSHRQSLKVNLRRLFGFS